MSELGLMGVDRWGKGRRKELLWREMTSLPFPCDACWAKGPRGPTGGAKEIYLLRDLAQADPSGHRDPRNLYKPEK